MSQVDFAGLYEYLQHTPEQGLRKMLIDNKPMTESHLHLLLKIVRGCNVTDFAKHAEQTDFPKLKMSPAEMNIKEKFWSDCFRTFTSRGILNSPVPSKVA